jgi:hypothetical protein
MRVNSMRFGVPAFKAALSRAPVVAAVSSAFLTSAGEAVGASPKYAATAPVTKGAAIDVPVAL